MAEDRRLRWIPLRAVEGPIRSLQNPLVKEVARLGRTRHRQASDLVLIEGPQLAAEALAAGLEVEVGFTTDPTFHPDAVEVSQQVLERVSTTKSANTVVLVVRRPSPRLPAGDVAVPWNVSDPGNLGALIRSAAAFGFGVVVAGREAADPWSPKALRAGAGGHFHTTIRVEPDLTVARLHSEGWTTVATVPSGGDQPADVPGRRAILVGSEAHGLPDEVIEGARFLWSVPTGPVESLNAAVAGALAMFVFSRHAG